MISNDPEKAVYMELFLNIPLKSIEIELKLIDLLVFGYIAEISGPFKIKQTLLDHPSQKLTDPMISNDPEKVAHMELVSLSLRISRA